MRAAIFMARPSTVVLEGARSSKLAVAQCSSWRQMEPRRFFMHSWAPATESLLLRDLFGTVLEISMEPLRWEEIRGAEVMVAEQSSSWSPAERKSFFIHLPPGSPGILPTEL